VLLLRAIESIVDRLLALAQEAVRAELAGDPQQVISTRFAPLKLAAFEGGTRVSDDCSCDGYYLDGGGLLRVPAICFRADVDQARVRFTLLHELGHHLLRAVAPELLDLVDEAAGVDGDPGAVEERTCQAFAAALLLPDAVVDEVLKGQQPRPEHLVDLHQSGGASWEAIAVKVASRIRGAGAVVLLREPGILSFAAPSPGMPGPWPRSSPTDPTGSLARAHQVRRVAGRDAYRWRLYGEQVLWCDTLPIHQGLAIGVLSGTPTDGGLNILPDSAPASESDPALCPRCHDGYLTSGWCDRCRGRTCPDCHACACVDTRTGDRVCSNCCLLKLNSLFADDSTLCVDCA